MPSIGRNDISRFDIAQFDDSELDGTDTADVISFNNYGLQNTEIITRYVKQSAPTRELAAKPLPRSSGLYVETDNWRENRLVIEGTLKADSRDELEEAMDEFRRELSVAEGVLKIPWAGAYRYFDCYAVLENVFGERDHFHVDWVPYRVEFVCVHPFGRAEGRTNYSSGTTTSPTTFVLDNPGSAPSDLITTLTFDVVGTVSAFTLENVTTAEALALTGLSLSGGDVITIDGENRRVTKNGVAADYTGVFPRLVAEDNVLKLTIDTGSGHTISFAAAYYPRYH